jgi:hypothetical protein
LDVTGCRKTRVSGCSGSTVYIYLLLKAVFILSSMLFLLLFKTLGKECYFANDQGELNLMQIIFLMSVRYLKELQMI